MLNIIPFVVFFSIILPLAHAQVDPASVLSRRAELEKELKQYETQIEEFQTLIRSKQEEGDSLKRDIDILTAEVSKSKIEIKARTLSIQKLQGDIDEKGKNIKDLEGGIEQTRASLLEFLREVRKSDELSLVELAMIYDDITEFFNEVDASKNLQASLQNAFDRITVLKSDEERAKTGLEGQKQEEAELKSLQELQRKFLEGREKEKQKLLKDTKGKESEYQKMLKAKQKDAANIKSQLFLLVGSAAISFEKALEYANIAERATGIRPAFLLGLITEESNFGQNVGKGNWQVDLSHSRCKSQREAFIAITSELGLDPNLMPVSKRQDYGYCGGAMGPAQFMPVTWQGYKKSVSKITGNHPPSPWEPRDAFVAAALLLEDNGAIAGNYNAEWKAAMKYLAGSNWNKSAYRFYGNAVMKFAEDYQRQIDILKNLARQ